LSFKGKTFTTFIALEFLTIFVCFLGVFSEVDTILEELFAALINTLEDTRRVCDVFFHVQFIQIVVFEILAAQKACVQNGGVNSFLVHV
jgi:hypothetical protein